MLAYSWARPAVLAADKGRGGMLLFLLFLHFLSFPSFFPISLFYLLYYLFDFFSPFLWEMIQNDPQGLTCHSTPAQSITDTSNCCPSLGYQSAFTSSHSQISQLGTIPICIICTSLYYHRHRSMRKGII